MHTHSLDAHGTFDNPKRLAAYPEDRSILSMVVWVSAVCATFSWQPQHLWLLASQYTEAFRPIGRRWSDGQVAGSGLWANAVQDLLDHYEARSPAAWMLRVADEGSRLQGTEENV